MLLSIALSSVFVFLLPTAAEGACEKDSLPCDDGQCILRAEWCDRGQACDDGSDEAYCKLKTWWGLSLNKCDPDMHFQCKDGRCWPLAARCDGAADCKDGSDENDCEPKEKKSRESNEEIEGSEEMKEKSEETKDEDEEDEIKETKDEDEEDEMKETKDEDEGDEIKEKSEEIKDRDEEDKSNEISEEEKKSSEENGTETPLQSKPKNFDDFDQYEHEEVEVGSEIVKHIPLPSVDGFSTTKEPLPEVAFRTTPMNYYANKIKHGHSTQINTHPTRAYRPPPAAHYPTSRKPAVPYTGPTRPYTPRPYRYIGAQYSGQIPSPHRGRYQPLHPTRGSYHSPYSEHISPQFRANYWQLHEDNDRADGRVAPPPRVYRRQLTAPSRFYFKKNYNEVYGRTNYPSVRRGVEWILSIRNATGGWGKETPRALVALSLVNNSFLAGSYENDLMQKYFQVHLGVNLLRNEPVSLNRLAMFVNALIATCQDPRDFQGWDLSELIRNTILKLYRTPRPPVINPLVYLSLCLADRNLTHFEVRHLMTYLAATRNDEVTRDMTCLALEAFACHMQKEKHNVAHFHSLQKMALNATSKILQRLKEDGSFGSVYSTALAAKALMSVNDTAEWNPEPTFRFLKNHQQRNGSFGNFLATYHVLPALSGRSLLHLRNTECNPLRVDRELSPQEILQHPGQKSYISYSLHIGSPLATGYTVQLPVPVGISFFDIMRVAAYENAHFKFSYEEVNGKINVYSISDIPNDPEEGLSWRLYIRSPSDNGIIPNFQQLYTGDIRELLPMPDQHIIFWYHPLGF